MAGVYASYSKWIDKGTKISKNGFSVPKKMLGVKKYGTKKVSSHVSDNVDKMVGWQQSSIIGAIKELVNE